MGYGERYKAELMTAIHNIDLVKVNQVIDCLRDARSHNRRIFTCGSGGGGAAGSQFLADTIKQANFRRGRRLRILCLNATALLPPDSGGEPRSDHVFIEQLKSFAEPGDVVIGVIGSDSTDNVLRTFEYARWIGCRTIAITGPDDSRVTSPADVTVPVPLSHAGSMDDLLMAVCHMIGYYFLDSNQ